MRVYVHSAGSELKISLVSLISFFLFVLNCTIIQEAKESGLLMAYSLLKHIARVPDIRVPLIKTFNIYMTIHGKRPPLGPISATPYLSSGSGCGSVFASSPAAVNPSIVVVGS